MNAAIRPNCRIPSGWPSSFDWEDTVTERQAPKDTGVELKSHKQLLFLITNQGLQLHPIRSPKLSNKKKKKR